MPDILDAVDRALERAFDCLGRLPPGRHARPSSRLAGIWDMLEAAAGPAEARPLKALPNPAEIDAMDRAFEWLLWVSPERRRIIAARATGLGYRRIGQLMGLSHGTVRNWHRAALLDIAERLLASQAGAGQRWH